MNDCVFINYHNNTLIGSVLVTGYRESQDYAIAKKSSAASGVPVSYYKPEGTINIPANCVLQFEGSSIKSGTIVGNDTKIEARLTQILGVNVTISGTWNVSEAYPEWWGAKKGSTFTVDNSDAIEKAMEFPCFRVVLNGLYGISKPIALIRDGVKLVGGQAINTWGNSAGIFCDKNTFTSITYDGATIDSMFYAQGTINAPFILEDILCNGNYVTSTLIYQGVNVLYSAHRVSIRMKRCHIIRFYKAGVILKKSDQNIIIESFFHFCNIGIAGEGFEIDYSNPLNSPSRVIISEPNHVSIENCQLHQNNIGIVFFNSSDLSITNCLFGYNSLCSMFIRECDTFHIKSNYIEGDCNYKFKIKKDLAEDPHAGAGSISGGTEIDQELSVMDVDLRACIRIEGETNVYIDKLFNQNKYVRSYIGAPGNAYENKQVSGIDSSIYIKGYVSMNISGMEQSGMYIDNVHYAAAYDVCYDNIDYRYTTINTSGKKFGFITSDSYIRYRNVLKNVIESGVSKDYAFGTNSKLLSFLEKRNSELSYKTDVTNEHPTQANVNFYDNFKYDHTENGKDYYLQNINYDGDFPLRDANCLRIPFAKLKDYLVYRAEIWYKPTESISKRMAIIAKYSDGSTEKIYDVLISSSDNTPLITYFMKNDFVKDSKTCTDIYIVNRTYGAQLVSPIYLYVEGDDNPINIPMLKRGTTRPKVNSGVVYEFFDESLSPQKPIWWTGTEWVDSTGTAV